MEKKEEGKGMNEETNKNTNDGLEVFGLISGLGNLPTLSALALGNCLEYNAI